MLDGSFWSEYHRRGLGYHLRVEAISKFFLSWRHQGRRLVIIRVEIFMQSTDKSPIFVKFFLAESYGVYRYIDFKLSDGILYNFQIEYIFVLASRSPYDPIDEDDSWEIIVKDATVDHSFSQLFDFERRRHIV